MMCSSAYDQGIVAADVARAVAAWPGVSVREAARRGFTCGWVTELGKLAALVPTDARLFVDIGCGDGALLAMMRTALPSLRLCGVEIVAARAATARCALRGTVEIHVLDGAQFVATLGPADAPVTLFVNDVAFLPSARCSVMNAAYRNTAITCVISMSGLGPPEFVLRRVAPACVSWRPAGEHFFVFVRTTTPGARRSGRVAKRHVMMSE